MTKDEVLKLALEAMEYADACLKKQLTMKYKHEYAQDLLLEAGTAIKEALAQPEQKFDTHSVPGKSRNTHSRQPEQEPVAWPKTPADISDMIGSSFVWREHKISDVEPHESDKYCVTAHDLLEALKNWSEYTAPPQPEQEPVGEVGQIDIDEDGVGYAWFTIATDGLELGDKLYTTPPQRKPLSDEEILTYRYMIDWTAEWSYINFARAIEAAHGIKVEA